SSRAAVPISSTLAFPSDQVVWQWRSPRICPSSTSGGGGPAGSPSRSSGGANGRPSAANTPASSAASGSGSSAPTHSADPVARTSAVPNDEAGATTSSTGVPSTVTPRWGATSATISGRDANARRTGSGSSAATATASLLELSRQRRGSPAGTPPSASAIRSTSDRARGNSSGRAAA